MLLIKCCLVWISYKTLVPEVTCEKEHMHGLFSISKMDLVTWVICNLFHNTFSVRTKLYSINDRVTSEWWWTDKDKHLCLKQDSNPQSQCPRDQSRHLRPRGHWNQLMTWGVVVVCGMTAYDWAFHGSDNVSAVLLDCNTTDTHESTQHHIPEEHQHKYLCHSMGDPKTMLCQLQMEDNKLFINFFRLGGDKPDILLWRTKHGKKKEKG
jgi:hypothetical protein